MICVYVLWGASYIRLDHFRWILVLATHLFTFGIVDFIFCLFVFLILFLFYFLLVVWMGYECVFIFFVSILLRLQIFQSCCVELGRLMDK